MAWNNVLAFPGVAWSATIYPGGATPSAPDLTESGGHFVATMSGGDAGWNTPTIVITGIESIPKPCNIRLTATIHETLASGATPSGGTVESTITGQADYGGGDLYYNADTPLDAVVVSGAWAGNPYETDFSLGFQISDTTGGDSYTLYVASDVDLLLEVDADLPGSTLWTDFVGCVETS